MREFMLAAVNMDSLIQEVLSTVDNILNAESSDSC